MRLAMGRQSACKAADDGNGRPAFRALLFRRNAVPDLAMDQQFSVAVVLPGHAPNLTPPRTGESGDGEHRSRRFGDGPNHCEFLRQRVCTRLIGPPSGRNGGFTDRLDPS